jgi:hypothetical protein
MADTEKIDVVRVIGEVLTEMDVLLASPDISDSDFKAGRKLRRDLDKLQLRIVAEQFRENTKKFQEAAQALEGVNKEISKTIADVEKIAETIGAIAKLISAGEKLLSIAIA